MTQDEQSADSEPVIDPWDVKKDVGEEERRAKPGVAVVCLTKKNLGKTVFYLGMNNTAYQEARVLRHRVASHETAYVVINSEQKTDRLKDRLKERDQVEECVRALCLTDKSKEHELTGQIERLANMRARAILFRIAEAYALAERGRLDMKRAILSGESYGKELFSRDKKTLCTLDFVRFAHLGKIFRKASGQVEHLLLSACSTGFADRISIYKEMYPNLLTIMGYAGKAKPGPLTYKVIEDWAIATRREGTKTLAAPPERRVRAKNGGWDTIRVATWSVLGGYKPKERPLEKVLESVNNQRPYYRELIEGKNEPSGDPEEGIAHDYFRTLMELIHRSDYRDHPELSAYEAECEQAKRLRYWATIRGIFGQRYAGKLGRGYSAAHLPPPDFAGLERRSLVEQIGRFVAAMDGTVGQSLGIAGADVQGTLDLLKGLYKLDSETIPEKWLQEWE